jgi:hypothetical protein
MRACALLPVQFLHHLPKVRSSCDSGAQHVHPVQGRRIGLRTCRGARSHVQVHDDASACSTCIGIVKGLNSIIRMHHASVEFVSAVGAALLMRVTMYGPAEAIKRHPFQTMLSTVFLAGSIGLVRVLVKRAIAHRRSCARTLQLRQGCLRCDNNQISIFCLNALAPNLVSKQRYKHVPDALLRWDYRFGVLKRLLQKVRIYSFY